MSLNQQRLTKGIAYDHLSEMGFAESRIKRAFKLFEVYIYVDIQADNIYKQYIHNLLTEKLSNLQHWSNQRNHLSINNQRQIKTNKKKFQRENISFTCKCQTSIRSNVF